MKRGGDIYRELYRKNLNWQTTCWSWTRGKDFIFKSNKIASGRRWRSKQECWLIIQDRIGMTGGTRCAEREISASYLPDIRHSRNMTHAARPFRWRQARSRWTIESFRPDLISILNVYILYKKYVFLFLGAQNVPFAKFVFSIQKCDWESKTKHYCTNKVPPCCLGGPNTRHV